ncbi:MAG TPA: isoprenylcysteine carboxylmethyltransferase family protein [Pseudolabrys sp.]|nr:isoprenylcysteine carboxylmethyltransferase family protein [Pseudolabrys sp.]
MNEARDNAGVIAPPPLLALAAIILGLLLDWLLPSYVLTLVLSFVWRILVGVILMGAGSAMIVRANLDFRSVGTSPEPWKPSTALVTGGIFGWLRNPMYVGATAVLTGLAILLASDWMLVMTIIFVLVLHFGVVRREERYLEARFGTSYEQYRNKVPRYGWPG